MGLPCLERALHTMDSALDRIEILSVSLLDDQRPLAQEMRQISEQLNITLGWHYLLDLTWAAQQLAVTGGMRVMDAGAGQGLMQWWLANRGVEVLSVDRCSRADLGSQFRAWCTVQGSRPGDLDPIVQPQLREFLPPRRPWYWHHWPRKLRNALSGARTSASMRPSGRGAVTIYNRELADMSDIADGSVDAVVSISALEHNELDVIRDIVEELMRVLKAGGRLIATVGAARDRDWFHKPSKGWCYTEATLRDAFDLRPDCPSNYDRYDELLQALCENDELRRSLSPVYSKSGDNGMPWGIWNPTYQPVGVVKQKDTRCLEV